ncbi:MAG TPA: DUF1109 domain-containing protein [Ramlibacter sp.]|nr:DUF1109 domain-containing protein [Ramlibacter sp.]
MKTDRLIALLAEDATPICPREAQLRFMATLAMAVAVVLLLTLWLLGMRPDVAAAARLPMFWWKLAFPAAVAACAWSALRRLGHPGMRLDLVPWIILAFFLLAGTQAVATLLAAAPADRAGLLSGQAGGLCASMIAGLSLPGCAAAFWAVRRLAPTRPGLTGAAAGLFGGACAACAYALHCTEMQAPFIAIWYSIGMLLPAAVGALAGRRLLRW